MKLNIFKPLFLSTIMLLIYSCKNPQTFLYNFDEKKWGEKDSLIFSFDIAENNSEKIISFFFRNSLDYPYRNLFLFIETSNDSSILHTDTVQYLISNKYGQWLGRGFGKTRDNYFIFKE